MIKELGQEAFGSWENAKKITLAAVLAAYTFIGGLYLGNINGERIERDRHKNDGINIRISNNSLASGFYGSGVNSNWPSTTLEARFGKEVLYIDSLSSFGKMFDPKKVYVHNESHEVDSSNIKEKIEEWILYSSKKPFQWDNLNKKRMYSDSEINFRINVSEGIDGGELGTWHWTDINISPSTYKLKK